MTKEDILRTLKSILAEINESENAVCYVTSEDSEAIDIAIKALEQEPKTGHWILDETDNSITCDKCGCLIWANDISNGEAYFCPNCGADMRG